MKKTGESDKNCTQCATKETSLRRGSRTSNVVFGNIQSDGLSKSCEKCKMLNRNVALTDKLWDGRLLLNSSVTVSAVAFFKSGEKMPGVKWSESIEVKGKVKLDDFVKYIQDLPRSRSKGLMVVTLRWKEGSSRLALAGMKKVAKRYQECERVGFAQISPGIVLYVCPHTETIITILAKYGFFKGKTAIEENKDSMIGCIVWRRNQINHNPVELKSERCTPQVAASQWSPISSQLSDQVAAIQWSPIRPPLSDKGAAIKWSPIHLQLSESLELSGKNCTALDAKRKDRIKRDKNPSKSPLGVHNFPTGCYVLTSQSTPSTFPSGRAGPETSHPDPEYQQASMEQSSKLKSERCTHQVAAIEWSPIRLPLESLALSGKNRTALDRGDLPEFNFGTSCGIISQAVINRALDSLPVDKTLPDKGFRHMDGSLPQKAPILKSWPTLHKRRLESSSHQGLSSDDDTQKMPPQKKACRYDNISMLPLVGDRQSSDMRKPYGTPVAPPAKNLFANNDDMAKWCPPDFNLKMQSIHPVQHSNFLVDSKEQKFVHPVQYAPAQNPFFSSACVAPNLRPPFPTQTPHFTFQPFHGPDFTGKHAQPRASAIYNAMGPSSMQINSFQPFRSGSCLVNGKMPINHEGWKGWNPYMPNRNGI